MGRNGSSGRTDVWTIVNAAVAVVALLLSVGIATGRIKPPKDTLRSSWEGETITAFGNACKTNRGSDCLRQWSYHFTTDGPVRDGSFTAELAWSFGGKVMIEGQVRGATLEFSERSITQPISDGTIFLCTYRLVFDSATQLHGTWNTCLHPTDGSSREDEGSITLNFDRA